MPKISIIMSVFNTAPYLRNAIDSILNQSFTDFELIIVDDASTDSSRDIISSYNDPRIVLLINERNLGIVASANKGLNLARGEYIARMDSDDISTLERLQIEYDFLEAHKDIFLVAGSFSYINSNGEVMSSHILELDSEKVASAFPKSNPIHQPTVMWRNDSVVFYREKALYCEDRDLWFRLSQQGKKFYVLKDILLLYRIHPGSVSISKKALQEAFTRKVNEWYFEREKNGSDSYKSFDADLFSSRIKLTLNSGNYTCSAKELKFFFKKNDDMKTFRKLLWSFWQKYGFNTWFPGYLYLGASFFPTSFIKVVRKFIWR